MGVDILDPCRVQQLPLFRDIGARAHAQVTGARLTGMTHGTFIVTGLFATDGTGNAVV